MPESKPIGTDIVRPPEPEAPPSEIQKLLESDKPLAGNFEVRHLMFGDFPEKHVFSVREFASLHPAPPNTEKAEYHDWLLRRALRLGAIAPTDAKPSPTPIGAFRPATLPPGGASETGREGAGPNEGVKPDAAAGKR